MDDAREENWEAGVCLSVLFRSVCAPSVVDIVGQGDELGETPLA